MSQTAEPSSKGGIDNLGFDPNALKKKYIAERDKRLRADGNEQYREIDGEFAHYLDDPYVEPGFTRAPLTDEVEVRGHRRRLRRPARRRAAARGRRRGHPHHREGRRLRRHLVLEPLSRRGLRHRELHLPAAARRDRLHPGREILPRAGDPRPQPRHRREIRPLQRRLLPDRGDGDALGRRGSRAGSSRPTAATR